MMKDITTLYSQSTFTLTNNNKVYKSKKCVVISGYLINLKPFGCCYIKVQSTECAITTVWDTTILKPFSQAWFKLKYISDDYPEDYGELNLVTSNHEIIELELTSFSY